MLRYAIISRNDNSGEKEFGCTVAKLRASVSAVSTARHFADLGHSVYVVDMLDNRTIWTS